MKIYNKGCNLISFYVNEPLFCRRLRWTSWHGLTHFFFCHDLQVVVRQSIGEIYKCRSITDPHYRLLNLESRYTLTEILPVNNRSWCTQRRNSLTKFWVKVGSCNHMLTSVKLHLNWQVPMLFTVREACKISFNWTYLLSFSCTIVAKGLGFSLIFSPQC